MQEQKNPAWPGGAFREKKHERAKLLLPVITPERKRGLEAKSPPELLAHAIRQEELHDFWWSRAWVLECMLRERGIAVPPPPRQGEEVAR